MEENTTIQPPASTPIANVQTPPFGINQTPQNISPVPPPVLSKKKSPAGLIIGIVLFLLLAGGAIAGFVYKDKLLGSSSKPSPAEISMKAGTPSPTAEPNPTKNWKTYKSDEVSFKYPPDMEVFGCGADSNGKILSVGIKKIDDKTTYCGIGGSPPTFAISTYGENKTIENYLTKLPLGTYQTTSPIQYGEINGLKFGFTTLSTEGGFSSQTHALINPANNKLYYINSNKDWKANKIILDQILSTFKFTDKKTGSVNFKDSNGLTKYVIAHFVQSPISEKVYLSNSTQKNDNSILLKDILGAEYTPYISTADGIKYILLSIGVTDGRLFYLFDENGKEIKIDQTKIYTGIPESELDLTSYNEFGKWIEGTTNFVINLNTKAAVYEATFNATTGKQVGATKQTKATGS